MKKVKLHTLKTLAAKYDFHDEVPSGGYGGFVIGTYEVPVEMFKCLGKEHNYETLLGNVQIPAADGNHTWFVPEDIIESRSIDMKSGDIVLFKNKEQLRDEKITLYRGKDVDTLTSIAAATGSFHVAKGPFTDSHFHINGSSKDWPYEVIKEVIEPGTIPYSYIISTIS